MQNNIFLYGLEQFAFFDVYICHVRHSSIKVLLTCYQKDTKQIRVFELIIFIYTQAKTQLHNFSEYALCLYFLTHSTPLDYARTIVSG